MTGETALTGPILDAWRACRNLIGWALAFSGGINLLYLAPSIFMLQIYDRVLQTGGLATLGFISLALVFALAALAMLDAVRAQLLTRMSLRIDRLIAPRLVDLGLRADRRKPEPARPLLRDFDILRQTIAGPAAAAVLDAPWMPLFILVALLIHPLIGLAVILGGALIFVITLISERHQRNAVAELGRKAPQIYAGQEADAAYAGAVRAMGMRNAMVQRHLGARSTMSTLQTELQFGASNYTALTRFVRLALQSGVLALGAWLAIERQITPGAMIAASILAARALSPLEQMIGAWRQVGQARDAYRNIAKALAEAPPPEPRTALPAPRGALSLERVVARYGQAQRPALTGVSIEFAAGEIVGVIGPSGAGKSTLAAIAAGASEPESGIVRLDAAAYSDWLPDALGQHIGYLPQEVALFAGTIAENIRRFRPRDELGDIEMIAAAKSAGAHAMILRLPHGYDTSLGPNGLGLSLGQAQRVGLARALFGRPALLVLDEPNAHLDAEGEAALVDAMKAAKARDAGVLIVAHRASVLAHADRLLFMREGRIELFGPRDEVTRRLASISESHVPASRPREVQS